MASKVQDTIDELTKEMKSTSSKIQTATNSLVNSAGNYPVESIEGIKNPTYVQGYINQLNWLQRRFDDITGKIDETGINVDWDKIISAINGINTNYDLTVAPIPTLRYSPPSLPNPITKPTVTLPTAPIIPTPAVALDTFTFNAQPASIHLRNVTVPTMYTPNNITIPTLNLSPLPVYTPGTITIPTINFPDIPVVSMPTLPQLEDVVVGAAPSISIKDAPLAPSLIMPELPGLVDVYIPNQPVFDIPVYDVENPNISTLEFDPVEFEYEEPYSISVETATIFEKLLSDIDAPLPTEAEDAIWARAVVRETRAFDNNMNVIKQAVARSGFGPRSQALLSRAQEESDKYSLNLSTVSRDLAAKRAELYTSHRENIFGLLVNISGQIMGYLSEYHNRMLQAAKSLVESAVQIYNARVEAVKLQIDVFRLNVLVWQSKVDAVKTRIEVYKAELETQLARGQINAIKVDVYKSQLQAVNLTLEKFNSEIRAFEAANNAELSKLQVFKAQVDVALARMQINKDRVSLYGAQIDAGLAPLKVATAKADLEKQKLSITAIQADLEKNKTDVYRAQLQARQSELESYNAQLQGVIAQSNIERTKAEISRDSALAVANTETTLAKLDADIQRTNLELARQIELKQAEVQAQFITENNRAKTELTLAQFRASTDATLTQYRTVAQSQIDIAKLSFDSELAMYRAYSQSGLDLARLDLEAQSTNARLIAEGNSNKLTTVKAQIEASTLAANKLMSLAELIARGDELLLRSKTTTLQVLTNQAGVASEVVKAQTNLDIAIMQAELAKAKDNILLKQNAFDKRFNENLTLVNLLGSNLAALASSASSIQIKSE